MTPTFANELKRLRQDWRVQRTLSSELKNAALKMVAAQLLARKTEILAANSQDLQALTSETSPAFRDRLHLNEKRLSAMHDSLLQVATLPDPVDELVDLRTLNNGLKVRRVRAPLGVIFMIFESRPNVILEAFSLAFKSGNSLILRGGSESQATAAQLYAVIRESLTKSGLQHTAFTAVEDYDRALVAELLRRPDLIDVVVPRGGDKLIQFVQQTAEMPIIKNDRGLCHTYVDREAHLQMALQIVNNAKTQRPGVCNSLETVLVHSAIASTFLPQLHKMAEGLEWHVDPRAQKILSGLPRVQLALEDDWNTEYLDLHINCRVVDDFEDALAHIEKYGSRHSEAIVTENANTAREFQQRVDAAACYWNASTRFTDGFEFGLGGELGISTQKLHVRGPVGLRELTTPRWLIDGTGQIRG